jgi:hypothetical protein
MQRGRGVCRGAPDVQGELYLQSVSLYTRREEHIHVGFLYTSRICMQRAGERYVTGLSKCKAAVLNRDPYIQGWVLEEGAVLRRVDLQERGRYIQGGVLYIYKKNLYKGKSLYARSGRYIQRAFATSKWILFYTRRYVLYQGEGMCNVVLRPKERSRHKRDDVQEEILPEYI